MNRHILVATLFIASATPSVSAQYCVNPQVSSGTPTGSSIIINNVDFPDGLTLQRGADDWNAAPCGNNGSAFPLITFGSQPEGNSRYISLYYDPGVGNGECGSFFADTITLYAKASAGNQVVSCDPVMQENWEHELGHALGLGDSLCSGYIMSSIHIDAYGNYNSRSIQGAECSAVDDEYVTTSEQLAALDWCNLSCPTGCTGYPPTCQGLTFDSGCPDCTSRGNSPIVLNLSRGAYRLTGTADPVIFDIDADGQPDVVAWTAAGAPMAFLVLDRNHNGIIDDGSELFGDSTPLIDGTRASNGFEALRELDTNGDGVVDAADADWERLQLWIDENHDGRSQPGELTPLSGTEITALKYSYRWTGRRDRSGNVFRWEAQYEVAGRVRTYYDIYFRVKP